MKNPRHEAILEIISERPVATQELLIELLGKKGIKTIWEQEQEVLQVQQTFDLN